MIFDSFALLCSGPVSEETELPVDHRDGYQHVADYSESGDAPQESKDQTEAAQKLGRDRQNGKYCRNSHLMHEEIHRSAESKAAEPAQHFLGAVGKEDKSQGQTAERKRDIVAGVNQFPEHDRLS